MRVRYLLALVVLLTGCSNRAVYDTVQARRRTACLQEPTPRYYEECMARTHMSYEEYERLLREQEKSPP